MLPQKRIEPDQSEGGRGGFEVHVIGASAPSSAAATAGGIEIGLQIGTGTPRHAAPAEADAVPVHRLEAETEVPPTRLKATSDVGPPVPRVSRRSRTKHRTKHWTLGMAALSCLIAVVAVVTKLAGHSAPAPEHPVEESAPPVSSDPATRERKYLFDNFGSLSIEAAEALERYAAARNAAEALPMIRNSSGLADRFSAAWQPWGEGPPSGPPAEPSVDGISPRPAIALSGKKGEAEPFQYYFVREAGELRLDWEASEGRGDLSIEELQSGAPASDAIVRARISPATYFTPSFPESTYRSYQLEDLSGDNVVWAFVPVDSETAGFLKRNLNEGSLILSARAALKVTLKVTRQPAEGANLFLITEILHNGWVSP